MSSSEEFAENVLEMATSAHSSLRSSRPISSMRDAFPRRSRTFLPSSSCIWLSSWGWSRRRSFLTTGKDARSRHIAQPSAGFSTFTRPRLADEEAMVAWLCQQVLAEQRQEEALIASVYTYCKEQPHRTSDV